MGLSGTSVYYGMVDVAGEAAQIAIADSVLFSGIFEKSQNVSVTVSGGTLVAPQGEIASFDRLDVGRMGPSVW